MITDNDKKWHYLFVKRLYTLLNGVTSNHDGSFHCLNCFYSFRTEFGLRKHKNVCKNHDYWYVEMPNKDNKDNQEKNI